jgi:hypothetical protein
MLPLPALQVGDVTAHAAVFEGYNDDVIEIPATATTRGERRGSPFTGLDLTLRGGLTGPRSSSSLLLGARQLHYTPRDQPVGADSRSALAVWTGSWVTGPMSNWSMGQSLQWADQDAVRLSESPLAALDAALGRKVFIVSTTTAQWTRELDARQRIIVAGGFGLRDVTRDESPISPYVGVDYIEPDLTPAYAYEFSARDVAEARLSLKYFYLPRALLDLAGRRGRRSTAQVTPNALWMHLIDEQWQAIALAGVSFSSTATDEGHDFLVTPTLGGQLRYMRDRLTADLGYALNFMPLTPSFAPGLANVLTAELAGQPWRAGPAKDFVILARFTGGLSYIPAGEDTTVIALDGGLGLSALYALTSWAGVFVGYEGRMSRASETGSEAPPTQFARNMGFVGLSFTLSTKQGELGMELPTRPAALTPLAR